MHSFIYSLVFIVSITCLEIFILKLIFNKNFASISRIYFYLIIIANLIFANYFGDLVFKIYG